MIRAILTGYKNRRLLALKDGSDFLSFKLYTRKSSVGRIINGKVDKSIENLNACFVRLSKEEYGFLGASLKPQTTLPVQIIKDPKGEKKPVVTTDLSLAGRYAVVIGNKTADKSILFSQRLSGEDKQRLKERFKSIAEGSGYTVLFRTNSALVEDSYVEKEIDDLCSLMDDIKEYNDKRTDFSILYTPKTELIRDLDDLELDNLGEIITDSEEEFEHIKKYYYAELPDCIRKNIKLTLYRDDLLSLANLVNLKAGLSKATDKKVWLKSGSYIVIEQTEALVSIDVNSGKKDGKGIREDNILKINEEAAIEIVRQLRLRNLSGIIIIDFINMKKKKSNEILTAFLRETVKKDSAKTVFMDMTKLGLVELTRKREGLTLAEMLADANFAE